MVFVRLIAWWVCLFQVKVVYIRNLSPEATEENIKEHFEAYGAVEKVKKMKDYCFIHYTERESAVKVREKCLENFY